MAGLALSSHAQTRPAADPVVITANPLRTAEVAAPVSTLAGEALVLRRGSSLGDTLDGLPGVAATWFGPNANRPVIRGLDGDRVRLLGNGGGALDASALSYDHAVPIDPLIVERVEVLRGPGALLYGGSAVGGVVNAIDNRIPRARASGLGGAAELRAGGAERERAAVVVLDGGAGNLAWHADAFGRQAGDLRVPTHVPLEDGQPLEATGTVRNSAARARGGAVGATLFLGDGRLGLSADTYDSRYGVVAEADITIRMKRDHLALAGEWNAPAGFWRGLRLNAGLTDYAHEEIEGTGEVGTRFARRGHELRLEAEHAPLGPLRGVLGLQHERSRFSALGAEAFVPGTDTARTALFVLEELRWAAGTTTAGLRLEHADIDSRGDADPAAPRFGAPLRRPFSPLSASLAQLLPLGDGWSLAGQVSRTERAPSDFELYADGVHAATGAYERGDAAMPLERATGIDLSLQRKAGDDRLRLNLFSTRFARYIALEATGDEVDETGAVVPAGTPDSLPLYRFRGVRARLKGIELEGRLRLLQRPWTVDASLTLDATRGENADTGEPLPRIAPWRARLGLEATAGTWSARIDVDRAARQGRVPANDTATAGFTRLDLSLAQRWKLGAGSDALVYARLANATDRLAYSASAIATIRGLAPLPGRSLRLGLRIGF